MFSGQRKGVIVVIGAVAFAAAFAAALLIGRAAGGEPAAAATVTRGLPDAGAAIELTTERFRVGPVPAVTTLPDLRPAPVVVRTPSGTDGSQPSRPSTPSQPTRPTTPSPGGDPGGPAP